MLEIPRYLITTSDERTWKFDRPVIFLGEWCRELERSHVWSKLDAIVAEPYGVTKDLKDRDYKATRELARTIFPDLCLVLNTVHGTNESEKFWKIVLGHWFRRHIEVVYNRTNTLMQCLENYQISGTSFYQSKNVMLATPTSADATLISNWNLWNNILFRRIYETNSKVEIQIDLIDIELSDTLIRSYASASARNSRKIRAYTLISKLGRIFMRATDALVINSYLPPRSEILLQIALKQFPQLNVSPKFQSLKIQDISLRNQLKKQLQKDSAGEIEKLIRETLFDALPICFLEAFSELQKKALQQPWPSAPKFVLTSNNFDSDDLFKVWVANKSKSATTYFVGQHGNGYGTHRFFDPTIEEETADHFLTWGWGEELESHLPAFMLSQDFDRSQSYDPKGHLLFIESDSTVRLQTWDESFEFSQYIKETQRFVTQLPSEMRELVLLKAHPSSAHSKWRMDLRWEHLDSGATRVSGSSSMAELISKSRLVVHTYDSTAMLKTLASDIPTIAFWQNGLEHLLESAIPYYSLLFNVGIIHFTPDSAAKKVIEIWDDVESWWKSPEVQNARKEFVFHYARTSNTPVRDLKRLLNR